MTQAPTTKETAEEVAARIEAAVEERGAEPKADVLGLAYESVWFIAETAKVSKARVRRVLTAFGPMFLERIGEGYNLGAIEGAQQMAGMTAQTLQGASNALADGDTLAAKNIIDDFLAMFTEDDEDDLADDPALD